MRLGFYLAHPGHFHLFKHVIEEVSQSHKVLVLYNEKDVLEDLILNSPIKDKAMKIKTNLNIRGKYSLLLQFIRKNWGTYRAFRKFKPDVVYGTPVLIPLIGRVLKYKSVIVNEDDFDIIAKTANLGYPHASHIICPEVCRTGEFDEKCVKHASYHELAYLHPNHFQADEQIVRKYIQLDKPYCILRFAKLSAHHDEGIFGINDDLAMKIIDSLKPDMEVLITTERKLSERLEPYRIKVLPKDMHHLMAFAHMYIGDSQTMAAEAAVLGTPFIRHNDFVGRISYLKELEDVYHLGYGIKTTEQARLFEVLDELKKQGTKAEWHSRRQRMLDEKIDFSKFLRWFVNSYPSSVETLKNKPDHQYNFK